MLAFRVEVAVSSVRTMIATQEPSTMEEVNIAPKNTTKSDLEKLSVEDAGSQSIEATPAPTESKDDEKQYPKRRKVIPIMAACYLSLFLVALVSSRT